MIYLVKARERNERTVVYAFSTNLNWSGISLGLVEYVGKILNVIRKDVRRLYLSFFAGDKS